jgi:DNA-binding transcriptional ArsR family regulator
MFKYLLKHLNMLNSQELAKLNKSVDSKHNDRLAIVFNALSDPNRCKIFRIFVQQPGRDICVSDVAKLLKISVPAASQHLKILEITGLVQKRRTGQSVHYKARKDDELINSIIKAIS